MKKYYLLIVLMISAYFVQGQITYEDFEDDGKLTWTPLAGTFEIVANPATDGINSSATVGAYTKAEGNSFSPVLAETSIDLSRNNQFKIQVYATNATALLFKLEGSPTASPKEISKPIPVANEWVELSFDFSEVDNVDDYTKIVLFFDPGVAESSDTYLFDNITALPPPLINTLENFEDGGQLTWTPLEGAFEIVDNPVTDGINASTSVGAYTKGAGFSYSPLVTEVPIDLTVNNQFKIQVYATNATALLFKLEGPTSAPKEVMQDIPVANEWVELSFDFSEVANVTDYSKIVLFFDPGVAESEDTYLFDNLTVSPNFLEDFEDGGKLTWEALNGTYNGIVANPDTDGINTTPNVGSYTKGPEGFSLFLTTLETPLDLSKNNQFKIQVYSEVASSLLVKLEGGSPPIEATQEITETGKWIELTYDFSSAASVADYTKIILFFDPGQPTTDTYLYDNIRLEPSDKITGLLEDFESGGKLTWESIDGTYNGIVANPATDGLNESANVGSFTKAPGISSGPLLTVLPAPLNLEQTTLLNIMVYAQNATEVRVRLEGSATAAPFEVQEDIPRANEWVMLSFALSDAMAVTDYNRLKLIFNPEIDATNDVYYFDNVELVSDPCIDVAPDINIVDNFECQRNAEVVVGKEVLRIVENPDTEGINSSEIVGSYTDPLDEFSALVYEYDSMPDLSMVNQLKIKVWAPKTGQLLFKLQGGEDAAYEIAQEVTEVEQWVEYTVDLSSQAATDHNQLALFFNAGVTAEEGDIYYLDDVQFTPPPLAPGLIEDFENGGRLTWAGVNGSFSIVSNPQVDGNNSTASVGEFTKSSGFSFAFSLADLPSPPDLSQNTTFRMQVYTANPTAVLFKLEGSATGVYEVQSPITVAEEWTELSFDFSEVAGVNDFTKVVIFFDPGVAESSDTYFFDNIRLGGGSGVVTGIEDEVSDQLMIYPNPANNILTVHIPESRNYYQATITDMTGRIVLSKSLTDNSQNINFETSQLRKGIYIISLENDQENVRSRFIKE